ncbi:MAG: hypothetical protein H7249_19630 [Chitinophagaceae bacterium]|nr:hypothetical protein [Oligoflexus sp.]
MIELALGAALLFGPHAPEAERSQKLSTFFMPMPNTRLELDRLSLLENRQTPETITGKIWMKPPKGQCLLVRTNLKHTDKRICKPTALEWRIDDLDALGHLSWTVLIEAEWDEGIVMKWNTDYRIGNFTAAGDKEAGMYEDIVIKTCKASELDGERTIVLDSFKGRRWRINLPEWDKPVNPVETPIPNLLVNIDSKKNADGSTKGDKKDDKKAEGEHGEKPKDGSGNHDKTDEKKVQSGGGSVLGALLSVGYKTEEVHKVTFNLPTRDAFQMESGRFTESGSPKGMNGLCRYVYKNAPGDPKSGAIECHDTDTLDNVYVHVTCFSELRPRVKDMTKEGTKK